MVESIKINDSVIQQLNYAKKMNEQLQSLGCGGEIELVIERGRPEVLLWSGPVTPEAARDLHAGMLGGTFNHKKKQLENIIYENIAAVRRVSMEDPTQYKVLVAIPDNKQDCEKLFSHLDYFVEQSKQKSEKEKYKQFGEEVAGLLQKIGVTEVVLSEARGCVIHLKGAVTNEHLEKIQDVFNGDGKDTRTASGDCVFVNSNENSLTLTFYAQGSSAAQFIPSNYNGMKVLLELARQRAENISLQ